MLNLVALIVCVKPKKMIFLSVGGGGGQSIQDTSSKVRPA